MKIVKLLLVLILVVHTVDCLDILISNYYGYPNDNTPDVNCFYDALFAARRRNLTTDPTATIIFGPGVYILDRTVQYTGNCSGITIDGRGAQFLLRNNNHTGFYFDNCDDFVLKNFTVDLEELPFTAGTVTKVNGTEKTMEVLIAPNHTAIARPVQAIITYDVAKKRYQTVLPSNSTYANVDVYQRNFPNASVPLSGNLLLVKLNTAINPKVNGTNVVLRYFITNHHAISIRNGSRVTVQDVTVYTACGMALTGTNTNTLTLNRFRVEPKPGRWMSTPADGTHLDNVRGTVTITDGYYEGMGDDAINIHNEIGKIIGVTNTSVGFVWGRGNTRIHPIYPNDVLWFGKKASPFADNTTIRIVATVEVIGIQTWVTFANGGSVPNVVVDDIVIVRSIASAKISNVYVRGNRARGFLINNKRATVENCTISDTTGPAILMSIETSGDWWEGCGAENVTVKNCIFKENNYGTYAGATTAVVKLEAHINATADAPDGAFKYINFVNNSFLGPFSKNAMTISSARFVNIEGNHFENHLLTSGNYVFTYCASKNVTALNNTKTSPLANIASMSCVSPPSSSDVQTSLEGGFSN